MITTLSHRWRRVFRHLAQEPATGMGFVLMLLGFLLQQGDGGLVVYCLTLGVLLSVDPHRVRGSCEPADASLILFALLLLLVTDDPFTKSVFFRQGLLPAVCAVIVAGRLHAGMIRSARNHQQGNNARPQGKETI